MGEEGRVHPDDPLPQALMPEVGWGVDDRMQIWKTEENGGPCPDIPRVGGMADFAGTADHRDSLRGPGSEKSELQGGHDGLF